MNVLLRALGFALSSRTRPLTGNTRKDPLHNNVANHERYYSALADIGACRYYERRPRRGDD